MANGGSLPIPTPSFPTHKYLPLFLPTNGPFACTLYSKIHGRSLEIRLLRLPHQVAFNHAKFPLTKCSAPRVWLITSGDSPVGTSLARQALEHGDYVVSGIIQAEFEADEGRSHEFKSFLAEVGRNNGWKERLKIVALDIRYVRCLVTG